jgi:hypothetical protein
LRGFWSSLALIFTYSTLCSEFSQWKPPRLLPSTVGEKYFEIPIPQAAFAKDNNANCLILQTAQQLGPIVKNDLNHCLIHELQNFNHESPKWLI